MYLLSSARPDLKTRPGFGMGSHQATKHLSFVLHIYIYIYIRGVPKETGTDPIARSKSECGQVAPHAQLAIA